MLSEGRCLVVTDRSVFPPGIITDVEVFVLDGPVPLEQHHEQGRSGVTRRKAGDPILKVRDRPVLADISGLPSHLDDLMETWEGRVPLQ